MGELVAHSKTYSNWLVYNLMDRSLYSYKEDYEKNQNREFLPYEEEKFEKVRNWALNLFKKKSIL